MPDILNTTNTTATAGYGQNYTNNIPPAAEQLQARGIAPSPRTSREEDQPNQQQDMQENTGQIRYDSNFQTFLQQLKSAPSMSTSRSLTALISGWDISAASSGDEITTELSAAMQGLRMDPEQLTQYLSEAQQNGTYFHGALFDLLRNTYAKTNSEHLQSDILQFLKSYLDHASTDHIENRMVQNLDRMSKAMPEQWSSKLQELTDQLKNGISAGDRKGNLTLLHNSVVPLMSKYVEATHDIGLPRRLLSLLTLDMARYRNGSTEHLLQTFHQLRGYNTLKNQLGALDDQTLLRLLEKDPTSTASSNSAHTASDGASKSNANASSSPTTQFADHLARSATLAMRGQGNAETQQIFQQLVSATLINESVYMPINHYLLPLEQDGNLSFAELWVDPDDESTPSSQDQSTVKLLLQIDVPAFGQFDIVLTNQDRNVDVQIACPKTAVPYSRQFEDAVSQIMTQSGLNATGIRVRSTERPLSLGEVFPKIMEGKDCVNVKV